MAERSGRPPLKAAFPPPPPFYNHFTIENVHRAAEPSQDQIGETQETFRYCIPPLAPADEKYRSFGAAHDLAQPELSLEDAGITQLYPADGTDPGSARLDPSPHMLSLSRSILLNFLELVGVLSADPAQHAEKIEHIQTLYFNVHHLINLYRPHQARESLILMMEEQIKRHRADIAAMNDAEKGMTGMIDVINETARQAVITPVAATSTSSVDTAQGTESELVQRQAQARQWADLEAELR